LAINNWPYLVPPVELSIKVAACPTKRSSTPTAASTSAAAYLKFLNPVWQYAMSYLAIGGLPNTDDSFTPAEPDGWTQPMLLALLAAWKPVFTLQGVACCAAKPAS
jgi:hypothetical protein